MKNKIHPKYNENIKAVCACGNSISLGSTAEKLAVEVCSACHPFYTGKQKLVDVAGRVDRFKKRLKGAQNLKKSAHLSSNKLPRKKAKKTKSVKLG